MTNSFLENNYYQSFNWFVKEKSGRPRIEEQDRKECLELKKGKTDEKRQELKDL